MADAAYDVIADWYEWEFLAHQRDVGPDHGFHDVIGVDEAIVELLGSGAGPCLEVGCGTGIYGDRLRGLGWEPVGVDLSRGMLRHAARRLPVAQADAVSLPFRSASLPAVAAIMVHTDMPDYRTVVREVRRVLVPGGRFVHVGVHPCFNGSFVDRSSGPDVVVRPGYLHPHRAPALDPSDQTVGKAGQVRDKVGLSTCPCSRCSTAWPRRASAWSDRSRVGPRRRSRSPCAALRRERRAPELTAPPVARCAGSGSRPRGSRSPRHRRARAST